LIVGVVQWGALIQKVKMGLLFFCKDVGLDEIIRVCCLFVQKENYWECEEFEGDCIALSCSSREGIIRNHVVGFFHLGFLQTCNCKDFVFKIT